MCVVFYAAEMQMSVQVWFLAVFLCSGGRGIGRFLPALSRLADAHVRLYADIHKCRRTDRDSGRARDIKRD